jgi:hypothetical protein
MTPPAFRKVIALMLSRFGHDVITDDDAPNLITSKAGRKFITACARPADAPLDRAHGLPGACLLQGVPPREGCRSRRASRRLPR